jgi:hypothetical protein
LKALGRTYTDGGQTPHVLTTSLAQRRPAPYWRAFHCSERSADMVVMPVWLIVLMLGIVAVVGVAVGIWIRSEAVRQ